MNPAQAAPELKLVPLYDRFDPVRGPCFNPGHPRIEDTAERERVAAFLRDGAIVLRSAAFEPDAADPSRGQVVPRSFRTDGQWVWSDALLYYLREHALAPSAEFYSHVVQCGYRCPEPERAVIRRAVQMLIGS